MHGFLPLLRSELNNPFPMREVLALLKRPYWYRIRTVQEVKLPPTVYCLCGGVVAPFRSIILGVEVIYHLWFLNESESGRLSYLARPLLPILTSAPGLMRSTCQAPDVTKQSLVNLVMENTKMQAADSRDYVFGALAMASDLHQLGVNADYTKNCLDVYTHVTAAIINQEGFELLSRCGGMRGRMSGLPSWVPDWSASGHQNCETSQWTGEVYNAGGQGHNGNATLKPEL